MELQWHQLRVRVMIIFMLLLMKVDSEMQKLLKEYLQCITNLGMIFLMHLMLVEA